MGKHRKPPHGPIGPDEREYEVGYGKPPKSGQFKKGQSGNIQGRPKAAKTDSMASVVQRVLYKDLKVQTQDGPVDMPTVEVILTAQAKAGAQGKVGSARLLLEMAQQTGVGVERETRDLAAEDEAQFDELMRAMKALGR